MNLEEKEFIDALQNKNHIFVKYETLRTIYSEWMTEEEATR